MAVMTNNKRSVMTLYSQPMDLYSHQARIVLAEKGVTVDVIDVEPNVPVPTELTDINPYGTVPTLIDRDLVLFDARIIMEYLDERFPHPPLMPVYPVARSKFRLMMYRIEKDWYSIVERIDPKDLEGTKDARRELVESLLSTAPLFAEQPYFLSEDYTVVDCCIAPILWRLPLYGIKLPKQAQAIRDYAARIFARNAFQASLSEVERELLTRADEL